MKLGMVGLGRMGSNMVRRLLKAGHECVAFDVHPGPAIDLAKDGATAVTSLAELIGALETPRAIWIMVPAAVVDSTLLFSRSVCRVTDEAYMAGLEALGRGLEALFKTIERALASCR